MLNGCAEQLGANPHESCEARPPLAVGRARATSAVCATPHGNAIVFGNASRVNSTHHLRIGNERRAAK
jgi:hypothetical protein